MASADTGSALPTSSKKVRLACRRCRAKRVKCDGGMPACGNCARAGVPCVDVDGRNHGLSIPRDFMTRYCARIRWLEDKIKTLDPAFDLGEGPVVDMSILDESTSRSSPGRGRLDSAESQDSRPAATAATLEPVSTQNTESRKRQHLLVEGSEVEQPLSVEARSVAVELGMLSLHSDSRQKHYLGFSSGLLFNKLIGLDDGQQTSASSSASSTFSQRRRIASPRCPSRETYRSLYSQLSKELPSENEAALLFGVYFNDIHVDHPFLQPKSLVDAYRALSYCAKTGCSSKIDINGWVEGINPFPYNGKYDMLGGNETTPISIFAATFHVFMVFSLAATILTRKKSFDHSPAKFYRVAVLTASECFSNVSVFALQGILLLIMQGLIGSTAISIWTLVSIAMSHCIDLGIHREPRELPDLNHSASTIRRFIFYTVYSLDRSISTIQGRPLGIRDETFDVRIPNPADVASDAFTISDQESELEMSIPQPENLIFAIHRFQMDQYVSEIKLLFYRLPAQGTTILWPTDLIPIQQRIKSSLDEWFAKVSGIPTIPDTDDDDENSIIRRCEKLKLEQLYLSTLTLLFQPSQVFRSLTPKALRICHQSSRRRLEIYKHLDDEERLYYNWRNVHGIFSSGATIVYCFWASAELQQSIPFAEAVQHLRICSNLLSVSGQWWPSLRNGKESFDKMVDLTIKQLSYVQNQPETASRRCRWRTGQPNSLVPSFEQDIQIPPMPDINGQDSMPQEPIGIPDLLQTSPTSSCPREMQSEIPLDSAQPNGSNMFAIDSAMEDFLAEYLHGDWGWDPFSGSIDNPIS